MMKSALLFYKKLVGEGRKMVTIDIPEAFLHAHNDDYVMMKMVGMLAKLMVKTNPRLYRQYLVLERGRSALYP